jgi:hypothetical protein
MYYQPLRSPDPQLSFGSLGDKMPEDMGGNKPVISLNPQQTGQDLTPEQKLAAAEAEIQRRQQQQTTPPGTTPPTTPPATEPQETDEQIQAKLDALATKDESTYTDEEKAYIAKHVEQELTPVDATKSYMMEKYSLDLAEQQYDNSPEGIAHLVDNVAPMVAEKLLQDHFASIPYMAEFYEHVSMGRGLETFLARNQKPAFESIDIREPNADATEPIVKQLHENQRAMIRLELQSKGMDLEEAESFVDLTESAGKLFERANKAKTYLKVRHEAAINQMMKEEEEAIQEEEREKQETAKIAIQMFEKNDFGGLSIPVADLKLFRDAVFQTDGQGKTLMDYKRERLTLAQRLFIDYIILKDFKGVGTPKAPQQSKQFVFKSKNEQNNSRNGGRTRGATQIEHPTLDTKDLNNLNLTFKT